MPQIREYTAQIGAQADVPGRRARVQDFNAIPADTGASLAGLGDTLTRVAEQQEVGSTSAEMAAYRASRTVRLAELEASADPGDTEFASRFNQETADGLRKIEDKVQTKAGRMFFQKSAADLSADFAASAGVAQVRMAGQKAVSNYNSSLESWGNTLQNDPTQFDAIRQSALDSLDDPDGPYAGMGVAARLKLREETASKLALSAVRGTLRADPARAQKDLEGGKWDSYLNDETKAALLVSADAGIARNDAKARTAANEARSRYESDFEIALSRGQKDYVDIEQAYKRDLITPEKRTHYTHFLDEYTKKAQKAADMVARVTAAGEGGQPLDPKSTGADGDRKALDMHYEGVLSGWKDLSPDEVLSRSVNYAGKYGMVPEKLQSVIRGDLRSGNPSQAVMAADTMTQLRNTNPQLLNDFADEDLRLGNLISSYTLAGVPADQAHARAQESLKVDTVTRETRKMDYNLQRGKTEADRIASDKKWMEGKLNSIWTSDPNVDPIMAREFDDLSRLEFERTGDLNSARQFALDKVNRVWGRSEVGGSSRYMKWAPEKFYSVPNLTPAENAKWMNEQLAADVAKGAMPDASNPITPDRVMLLPDPTRQNGDGRPTYVVGLKGADGIYYGVSNASGARISWVPDWASSAEKKRRDDAAAAKVEAARAARQQKIDNLNDLGSAKSRGLYGN